MAKIERRRQKIERRREIRRERKKEKKIKKRKDDEYEEGSKRVGNLGWRRESSEVRGRCQEIGSFGFSKVSQIDLCLWEKSKWENAGKENVRLYNWVKEEIYTKKEKDLSVVKRGERKDVWIY